MNLLVGVGNKGNGGAILLTAGETTAGPASGGQIDIVGGLGSNTDADGGKGGHVRMTGGEARGTGITDNGGNVEHIGGMAKSGFGGTSDDLWLARTRHPAWCRCYANAGVEPV